MPQTVGSLMFDSEKWGGSRQIWWSPLGHVLIQHLRHDRGIRQLICLPYRDIQSEGSQIEKNTLWAFCPLSTVGKKNRTRFVRNSLLLCLFYCLFREISFMYLLLFSKPKCTLISRKHHIYIKINTSFFSMWISSFFFLRYVTCMGLTTKTCSKNCLKYKAVEMTAGRKGSRQTDTLNIVPHICPKHQEPP